MSEELDKRKAAATQKKTDLEKQLKDYGEKISADKKAPIEAALAKLKEAHKSQDIDQIDSSMAELNAAWTTASEEMYKATQEGAGDNNGAQQPGADAGQAESAGPTGGENVTDAEFEEVK